MGKFKKFDAGFSIILILAGMITGFVKMNGTILYVYFIVGGWQTLSMIVHLAFKLFTRSKPRVVYHIAILNVLILILSGCIVPKVMKPALDILLIASPVLAVYYSYVCYHEAFVLLQRPLALLR